MKMQAPKERGASFMVNLMLSLAIKYGRSGVRWILYPTVAYFLLTAPKFVRASRNCLKRILGRPASIRDVWKHFFAFSSCTQDRIFLLSNNTKELRIDAFWSPDIPALLEKSRGVILLVGHVGSREALRLTPRPPQPNAINLEQGRIVMRDANLHDGEQLDVAILLDRSFNQRMTEMFEQLNPQLAANIIDASERGPALALKLKEALHQGKMVGIGADRAQGEERTVLVEFMGGKVNFPEGPWTLASALGVPVFIGCGLYCGANRYEAHFELFAEKIITSRTTRKTDIQAYAQAYAKRMEHYARLSPYNWFNFYDYWIDDAATASSATTTPS